MVCTVVGKIKKPYNIDGNSGVSSRLSLFLGDYQSDSLTGSEGVGEQYIEVKCPVGIADQLEVGDDISVELDDKRLRIKSCMIQIDAGNGKKAFIPLGDG